MGQNSQNPTGSKATFGDFAMAMLTPSGVAAFFAGSVLLLGVLFIVGSNL